MLVAIVERTGGSSESSHGVADALRSVFSSSVLMSIAAIYFVTQLCGYGIAFFMPSIVESFGVTGTLSIGAVSGLPAVGALIGVVIYPRMYRSMGQPIRFIATAMIGAALATFVASQTPPAVSLFALGVMLFFVVGTGPVLWSVAMSRINGLQAAAGLAMVNAIGLLGGFFGPNLFGIAESKTGDPGSAIILLTFASLLGLGVTLLLRRQLRAPQRAHLGNGQGSGVS